MNTDPTSPQKSNPFVDGEGDKWYERNLSSYTAEDYADMIRCDHSLRMAERFGLTPTNVLEVGCSNGWRLEELRKRGAAACFGLDPSSLAVSSGRQQYPQIELAEGTADSIPAKDGQFDLVIMHGVFLLIPRELLLRSCAEIDRVLADGGFLIVDDFLPDAPTLTPWHHLPGGAANSYKLDHAAIFTATAMYTLCGKTTYDHRIKERDHPTVPSFHRRGCSLLRKSLTEFLTFRDVE